jgi:hypothetical protein
MGRLVVEIEIKSKKKKLNKKDIVPIRLLTYLFLQLMIQNSNLFSLLLKSNYFF